MCSGKVRDPAQTPPCAETSSRVLQKLTFRLWHSVHYFLDQPAVRMGVTVSKEHLTKCNFSLSETMVPAVTLPFQWERTAWPSRRNMLAVKEVHGKWLQVSAGL